MHLKMMVVNQNNNMPFIKKDLEDAGPKPRSNNVLIIVFVLKCYLLNRLPCGVFKKITTKYKVTGAIA